MNNDWRQGTTSNADGRYQGNAYSYRAGGESRRAYYNGEEAYSPRTDSAQGGYTPYTARHAAPADPYRQSAYQTQDAYRDRSAYRGQSSYQGQSAYQAQSAYQGQSAYQSAYQQPTYQQAAYQQAAYQQTEYRPAYQQQSAYRQAAYQQPAYRQQDHGYRQDGYSYSYGNDARGEEASYSYSEPYSDSARSYADYQRPSYAAQQAEPSRPTQNTASYRPMQEDGGYRYGYQREDGDDRSAYQQQGTVYPPQAEEQRTEDSRYSGRARREQEPARREEPAPEAPERPADEAPKQGARPESVLRQPVRQTPQQRLERMRIAGEAALRAQGYQEEDANRFMNTGMIHLDAVVGSLNQDGLNAGGVDPVISAQQTARMAVIKQAQMDIEPLQQPTGSMPHSRPDYSLEDYEEGRPSKPARSGLLRNIIEWVIVLSAAIALAFLIRTFVCSFYRVDGPSMQPTLHTDERLFVNKIGYRFGDIDRYDVVICHYPDSEDYYVKRVIGLPGDTVSIDRGQVNLNGMILEEPYVEMSDETGMAEITLGDDEYLVFGDNRSNSMDSRSIGPLTRDQIVGHAVLVTWPVKAFKRLPEPDVTETEPEDLSAAVEEEPILEDAETVDGAEETDDAEGAGEDTVGADGFVGGVLPPAAEETPATVPAP